MKINGRAAPSDKPKIYNFHANKYYINIFSIFDVCR